MYQPLISVNGKLFNPKFTKGTKDIKAINYQNLSINKYRNYKIQKVKNINFFNKKKNKR